LTFGVPLVTLVVSGFYGLTHLVNGRKEVEKAIDEEQWAELKLSRALTREGEIEGGKVHRKVNLEDELKKLREKVNIHDYENKPVPKATAADYDKSKSKA